MNKKFSELRAAMSPEAQERAANLAKEMLARFPSLKSAWLGENLLRFEMAKEDLPVTLEQKIERYKPKHTFNVIVLRAQILTGKTIERPFRAYLSAKGIICFRQAGASGITQGRLGQFSYDCATQGGPCVEMFTLGHPEDKALFYRQLAKAQARIITPGIPHFSTIMQPDNDLIEKQLIIYGRPANMKNAARAGWRACFEKYRNIILSLYSKSHHVLPEVVMAPRDTEVFSVPPTFILKRGVDKKVSAYNKKTGILEIEGSVKDVIVHIDTKYPGCGIESQFNTGNKS